MRDFLLDQFDTETADQVVPNYLVEDFKDLAREPEHELEADQVPATAFTAPEDENMTPEQIHIKALEYQAANAVQRITQGATRGGRLSAREAIRTSIGMYPSTFVISAVACGHSLGNIQR